MNEEQFKKEIEQNQTVLNALNQQRKGGLELLEQRVSNLLDKDITVDNFQNPKLVDTLREAIQSLNSALLILGSHDKLIDALMRELMGLYKTVQEESGAAMQASFATEVVGSLLLEKGVFTTEELEGQQAKIKQHIEAAHKEMEKRMEEAKAAKEKKVEL